MLSSTSADDRHVAHRPAPFEHLDLQRRRLARRRGCRPSIVDSTRPSAAATARGRSRSTTRFRRGVSRQPGDGERARPVAGAQAHRHAAHRLDVHDARQVLDRVHGARPTAARRRSPSHPGACATTNCWSISTSITSMNARPTNSTATAKAMPTTESTVADRLALEVAQDHPRRQRQAEPPPRPLDDAAAVARRRLRTHRFGRRNADGAPDRRLRAQRRDDEADRRATRRRRRPTAGSRAPGSGRTRCRARSCPSRATRRPRRRRRRRRRRSTSAHLM